MRLIMNVHGVRSRPIQEPLRMIFICFHEVHLRVMTSKELFLPHAGMNAVYNAKLFQLIEWHTLYQHLMSTFRISTEEWMDGPPKTESTLLGIEHCTLLPKHLKNGPSDLYMACEVHATKKSAP